MGANTFRLLDNVSNRAAVDRFCVRTASPYANRTAAYYAPVAIPCPWDSDDYGALPSGLWYIVTGGRSTNERTGLAGHIGVLWTYTPGAASPGATLNIVIGGTTVDTVTVSAGQPRVSGVWWLPDSYFSSPYLPSITTSGGGGYLSGLALPVPDGFLCSDAALGAGWSDTADTCLARERTAPGVDSWAVFNSKRFIGTPVLYPSQVGGSLEATDSRAPAWSGTKPADVLSPGGNDSQPICTSNLLWDGSALKRFLIPNGMPFVTASGSMFGPAGASTNIWLLAPREFRVSSAFTYTVTVTVGATTIATATGTGTTTVSIAESDAISNGPLDATITLTAFGGGGGDTISWSFNNRYLPPPVTVPAASGSALVQGRRHASWTFTPPVPTSRQVATAGALSFTHTNDIYGRAPSATLPYLPPVVFSGLARGWYIAGGGGAAWTPGYGDRLTPTNTGDAQAYPGSGGFIGYRLAYSAGAYQTTLTKYTPSHAVLSAGSPVALTQGAGWYWGQFTAASAGRYRFSIRPASIYHPCRVRVLIALNDPDAVNVDYDIGAEPPAWAPEHCRPLTRTATPPVDDWYGQRLYCVATGATGAWAGKAGQIAVGDQLGAIATCQWSFIVPQDGMLYGTYRSVGGAWVSATEDVAQEVEMNLAPGDVVRIRASFHGGTDTTISGLGGSTVQTFAERTGPYGWPGNPGIAVNCTVTAL